MYDNGISGVGTEPRPGIDNGIENPIKDGAVGLPETDVVAGDDKIPTRYSIVEAEDKPAEVAEDREGESSVEKETDLGSQYEELMSKMSKLNSIIRSNEYRMERLTDNDFYTRYRKLKGENEQAITELNELSLEYTEVKQQMESDGWIFPGSYGVKFEKGLSKKGTPLLKVADVVGIDSPVNKTSAFILKSGNEGSYPAKLREVISSYIEE